MRLSEAMRLGSMWKPQAFGAPGHALKYEPTTCVLAAAAEAMGDEHLSVDYRWLQRWPYSLDIVPCPMQCPAYSPGIAALTNVCAHLNDKHKWTREQIADWVEGLEQAQEQPETLAAVDPGVQSITESLRA